MAGFEFPVQLPAEFLPKTFSWSESLVLTATLPAPVRARMLSWAEVMASSASIPKPTRARYAALLQGLNFPATFPVTFAVTRAALTARVGTFSMWRYLGLSLLVELRAIFRLSRFGARTATGRSRSLAANPLRQWDRRESWAAQWDGTLPAKDTSRRRTWS